MDMACNKLNNYMSKILYWTHEEHGPPTQNKIKSLRGEIKKKKNLNLLKLAN
jgi:hypothetical protein